MPHKSPTPDHLTGPHASPVALIDWTSSQDTHEAEETYAAGDFSEAFPTLYGMDQASSMPQSKYAEGKALLEKVNFYLSSATERVGLIGNRLWERSDVFKEGETGGAWSPLGPSNLGSKKPNVIEALKKSGVKVYGSESELPGYSKQEYGAPTINKEAFFNKDGSKKPPQEVARTIKAAGGEGTYEEILQQVIDFMPKLEEAPEKEKAFISKEREFADREAKMGRQKDLYGLQKEAGKMGTQMRGAYGGMGGGMRGAMAGGAQMGKEFGVAQDVYGLQKEKAAFAEGKELYGLEEEMYQDFESEVSSTFFRKGGRVPEKGETFLNMLTQLPDAGGS
jgi:hypothetical protein